MPDNVGLQDGMRDYYLTQARASDANVEARLDKEPFDYRGYLRRLEQQYPSALNRTGTLHGTVVPFDSQRK